MYKELDAGTDHHRFMHTCNNFIEDVKDLTNDCRIINWLELHRVEVEQYVMSNIEGDKSE